LPVVTFDVAQKFLIGQESIDSGPVTVDIAWQHHEPTFLVLDVVIARSV
jgi:hypothetical protein